MFSTTGCSTGSKATMPLLKRWTESRHPKQAERERDTSAVAAAATSGLRQCTKNKASKTRLVLVVAANTGGAFRGVYIYIHSADAQLVNGGRVVQEMRTPSAAGGLKIHTENKKEDTRADV